MRQKGDITTQTFFGDELDARVEKIAASSLANPGFAL
jgi:hypothetical protein